MGSDYWWALQDETSRLGAEARAVLEFLGVPQTPGGSGYTESLSDNVKGLVAALSAYGRHWERCAAESGHSCTCGWSTWEALLARVGFRK